MGKIYHLTGKSNSGKDTLFKRLLNSSELDLKMLIEYTTRPKRDGEIDGRDYKFITKEMFDSYLESNKVIEMRCYHTTYGDWYYGHIDEGIDLENNNYIMQGAIGSYEKSKEYFDDKIVPICIEVDDGDRLIRAINREKMQREPKYVEMCRRFIADDNDYRPEVLERLGITKKYYNNNLEDCLSEITKSIMLGE